MPGTRRAMVQYWRVVGPRTIAFMPISPALIAATRDSCEKPTKCGRCESRTNHAPMSSWVALRLHASKQPPQAWHAGAGRWLVPQ